MVESAEAHKLREMPVRSRTARPVTNLAKVFGQFAQLQQQFEDQMCALEESVDLQRTSLAAELPVLKQRINWLTASFQDQNRKDADMRERVGQSEIEIAAVQAQVRTLIQSNAQWQRTVDQLAEVLVKARSSGQRLPAISALVRRLRRSGHISVVFSSWQPGASRTWLSSVMVLKSFR